MVRSTWLLKRAITVLAVTMSFFHLYVAYAGPPNAFTLRATHFGFALVLAYLSLPGRSAREGRGPGALDWLFLVGSVAASAYPLVFQTYFNTRMAYVGPVSVTDQTFAILMIVVVLEATRRRSGRSCPSPRCSSWAISWPSAPPRSCACSNTST